MKRFLYPVLFLLTISVFLLPGCGGGGGGNGSGGGDDVTPPGIGTGIMNSDNFYMRWGVLGANGADVRSIGYGTIDIVGSGTASQVASSPSYSLNAPLAAMGE